MADWYVGQKVVCIDDSGWFVPRSVISGLPIKWRVYTIRSVIVRDGQIGFLLEEFHSKKDFRGDEWGFAARRFRPVVEDRTQFSLLQSIADRVGKRVKVRA